MKKVYFSLGANLGDRERALEDAIHQLHGSDLRVLRISSVFETEPLDVPGQPWFLNLVVEAETELFPMQLLSRIQRVEQQLGRKRLAARGPRTIDIDILLYSGFVIQSSKLEIPHPRMTERRFVLEPLAELAPELRHPLVKRTVRDLLGTLTQQMVRRVSFKPKAPDQS